MKPDLKKWMGHLILPIQKEPVFFFVFLFLITPTLQKWSVLYALTDVETAWRAFRYLSSAVLLSYCLTALVLGCHSRVLKVLSYVAGLLLFAVYMFLWLVFHQNISPLLLQIAGETNVREATEFAQTFFGTGGAIAAWAAVVLMVGIIYLLERRKTAIGKLLSGRKMASFLSVSMVVVLLVGIIQLQMYAELFRCESIRDLELWEHKNEAFAQDSFTALLYSMQGLRVSHYEVDRAVAKCREVSKRQPLASDGDSLTVIYVLGESYIKSHCRLYGYPLMTTPQLCREKERGNLFVFNDVVSPTSSTTIAEKNSFCCNSMADGELWYEHPFFPTIFKKAGYDVLMWDIQRDFQENALYTFSVNAFLYNKEIQQRSYSQTCKTKFTYDGELVDDFLKHAVLTGKRKLAIFHLIGQHIGFHERFPDDEKYKYFSPKDISWRHEEYLTETTKHYIADYDNATLYNDGVLGRLFDRFREDNAVLVYFSDHGEEAYDYRNSMGRKAAPDDVKKVLKYQHEIPFVIWCSDRYMATHHQVVEALRQSLDKPAMSDNVCQVLFHLSGLNTPYYIADRDLLSPSFKRRKRMVNGKWDYDAFMHRAQ